MKKIEAKMKARIIVAGSRDYKDYGQLADVLDRLMTKLQEQSIDKSDVEIVSGGCRGADELGERYAKESCIRCSIFPADWSKYGRSAGPIRNDTMAKYAVKADKGYLVAFPIGESRGTRSMIKLAEQHGLEVTVIEG